MTTVTTKVGLLIVTRKYDSTLSQAVLNRASVRLQRSSARGTLAAGNFVFEISLPHCRARQVFPSSIREHADDFRDRKAVRREGRLAVVVR